MIDSILLVDDENLFHLVFEDACSLLDITLNLKAINNADEAEKYFADLVEKNKSKPDCIFVDLNIIGSSFDGIELVRRINFEHGDGVVIERRDIIFKHENPLFTGGQPDDLIKNHNKPEHYQKGKSIYEKRKTANWS